MAVEKNHDTEIATLKDEIAELKEQIAKIDQEAGRALHTIEQRVRSLAHAVAAAIGGSGQ